MFIDFFKSVFNLSIPKKTFLLLFPNLELIMSSALSISLVFLCIFLFIRSNINSECAFLLIESLKRFVHTR